MSAKLQLTIACGDYEIIRPLKEGVVRPDGIELVFLTQMDSNTRHHRFMHGREFDIAELSASTYLVSRGLGQEFMSLPVFLHRRFRHGMVYVNTASGIRTPKDLEGRRIGLKSWTNTATLWMRGILASEYDVDLRSITWTTDLDEHVDGFAPSTEFRVARLSDDQSIEDMLAAGDIDALLHPDIIEPMLRKDPRVARLFPDPKAEQIAYFTKTGIFPIMHVTTIKPEVLERHPWVAHSLMAAFDKAKALTMRRMENPRIVPLALWREEWETQQALFGADPWAYGLTPSNITNLQQLIEYAYNQRLTSRQLTIEELFLNPTAGAKRDGIFRY